MNLCFIHVPILWDAVFSRTYFFIYIFYMYHFVYGHFCFIQYYKYLRMDVKQPLKSYSTCRIVHASWSSKFRSMYSLTATLAEISLRSNSSAKYETSKSPQLTCSNHSQHSQHNRVFSVLWLFHASLHIVTTIW